MPLSSILLSLRKKQRRDTSSTVPPKSVTVNPDPTKVVIMPSERSQRYERRKTHNSAKRKTETNMNSQEEKKDDDDATLTDDTDSAASPARTLLSLNEDGKKSSKSVQPEQSQQIEDSEERSCNNTETKQTTSTPLKVDNVSTNNSTTDGCNQSPLQPENGDAEAKKPNNPVLVNKTTSPLPKNGVASSKDVVGTSVEDTNTTPSPENEVAPPKESSQTTKDSGVSTNLEHDASSQNGSKSPTLMGQQPHKLVCASYNCNPIHNKCKMDTPDNARKGHPCSGTCGGHLCGNCCSYNNADGMHDMMCWFCFNTTTASNSMDDAKKQTSSQPPAPAAATAGKEKTTETSASSAEMENKPLQFGFKLGSLPGATGTTPTFRSPFGSTSTSMFGMTSLMGSSVANGSASMAGMSPPLFSFGIKPEVRLDLWSVSPSDGILRGVEEGTNKTIKSSTPVASVPLSNQTVMCLDGKSYYLLRHESDVKKKRKPAKKRKVGEPSESVTQMKDVRTTEQMRMMAFRGQIAMSMTQYDTAHKNSTLPSSQTFIVNRDEIVCNPNNATVQKRHRTWTAMSRPGTTKKDLIDHFEELLKDLKKNKVNLVDSAEGYLDSLYGTGAGKKLLKDEKKLS
jgi:hypothetical protein